MLGPLKVAARNKPILSFGIVTDSHYADRDTEGARHYRESISKMEAAMAEMNARNVDFVVHLGDFKDQAKHPDEASTLDFLVRIEKAFAKYRGPRYHVLGNHDMDSITKAQFLSHVENTGIDPKLSYYSFDRNGVHFVVLDGNFTQSGTAYEKGNFHWTDAFIPDDQLQWLKRDLQSTTLPCIVFVHQLIDDHQGAEDKKYCLSNGAAVRQVLNNSGKVVAVFQGHRHEERYSEIGNIHYCTLPGMVDHSGLENNSFSIVEVYKDALDMKGYKRAPSRKMGGIGDR